MISYVLGLILVLIVLLLMAVMYVPIVLLPDYRLEGTPELQPDSTGAGSAMTVEHGAEVP